MPFRKPWEGWEDTMVRRSIFLPEDLELALAKMALDRGTSVNELIRELLERAVKEDHSTRSGTE
jgi:predicted HicB family RNase H-like nuclease